MGVEDYPVLSERKSTSHYKRDGEMQEGVDGKKC
jgi:hypothetical protein